jgi:hypothetical protein
MVCADDVNLLGGNINVINKNTEAVVEAIKEVGLEVNAEKTKYMFMSHRQTTRQNLYIKVANKSVENVAEFKSLSTTLTNNCIHEEIKSRLNLGNACYHAVQNLLCSCLLFRDVNIKIYKTNFSCCLYDCET